MWNKHHHHQYHFIKRHVKNNTTKVLGIFMLCMINVAAIISLRNLPLMATYGFASIFFYVMAGLVFFIPLAFVTAELATAMPSEGGVYTWVKEAFGLNLGFLAIWLDWIANTVFFPTLLSFVAATIAFIFNPALAHQNIYIFFVSLGIFWLSTFANLFGAKLSGLISSVGVILGTIIPGVVVILLAIIWLGSGHPAKIHFGWGELFPHFSLSNMVFFAGVILGLSGIEVASYHAREARNPRKDYPKAILLSALIILVLFCLGSLAIAIVVPKNEISLVAGLMQAFTALFKRFDMAWALPYMAVLVAVGAIAMLSTWIIGPCQGLIDPAKDGALPPLFHKESKHGVPIALLVVQTVLASLFLLIFIMVPNINSSYWMLTALASQVVVIMYFCVFAAAIRLRYSRKDMNRPFKVPGGNAFMWLLAGIGLLACVFTFVIGFIPPSNISGGHVGRYELIMIVGLLVLVLPPLLIPLFRKPSWQG